MTRPLPIWRSLLYVPAHVERYVEKAHARGADCIQLDLEDSVPADRKAEARSGVAAAAARVRRGGADVVVRINRPLSLAVRDLEAVVGKHVDGIVVPKVGGAAHLELLDELVSELERDRGLPDGHTRIVALVESASAWPRLHEIAASRRVVALNMGNEDFAADCGMQASEATLQWPRQALVVAASAARVLPIGLVGSLADFTDVAAFRALAVRSKQFGYTGSSCIHPDQVAVLNDVFSPSDAEVDAARRVVDALEAGRERGRGAVSLGGRMVDAPIAARARHVLERHAAIVARAAARTTAVA